jgi:hypothetical protein
MFIENGSEIKISLYTRSEKNKLAVTTSISELPEAIQAKYEKSEFKLKPLGWKQHNDIQRAATINRGTGMGSELDWVLYKERKLCAVLVGWDAKDKDGKPIPVSDTNIFKLHPEIAEVLLKEFDDATVMGEEERKN